MTEQEYIEDVENGSGYYINCKSVTGDFAEPDARNYECPECGKMTVFGMEQALLEGFITFTE